MRMIILNYLRTGYVFCKKNQSSLHWVRKDVAATLCEGQIQEGFFLGSTSAKLKIIGLLYENLYVINRKSPKRFTHHQKTKFFEGKNF